MGVLFSRDKATTGIAAMLLRLANLPVRHVFSLAPRRSSPKRTRYSGEQLRKIRAEKGVGRPIGALSFDRIQELRWRGAKFYPAAAFASVELPSPNLAEWQRKPRPKDRSAANGHGSETRIAEGGSAG